MDELTTKRLSWFGGNQDALSVYLMFIKLSHTWDDLIDKNVSLTSEEINHAFMIPLIYLPANPFYRAIQADILPMLRMVISAYETANTFEKLRDPHGIEISHSLRYAAGHIVAYMIHFCIGDDAARQVMPDMWKDIFYERFNDYREEHINA